MILASIFIGPAGGGEDVVLPSLVEDNIASLKRHHPAFAHRLFTGADIVAFLEDRFPREVRDAFQALRPHAYKADLARYCILYELGGIYADLSFLFLGPLPLDDGRPIVFRDLPFSAPWDVSNGVIVAPPRHKALECAIELVCANVKRGYYGATSLCPTGPTLFGKALAMTCEAEDLVMGVAVATSRARLLKSVPQVALPWTRRIHCKTLDGKLVAIKRKRTYSGGLDDLGVVGSDNYSEHWTNRTVYLDPPSEPDHA